MRTPSAGGITDTSMESLVTFELRWPPLITMLTGSVKSNQASMQSSGGPRSESVS
jgi:hypothetical protein